MSQPHSDVTLTLAPYVRRAALDRSLPHLIVSLEAGRPSLGATRIRLDSIQTVLLGRGATSAVRLDGERVAIELADPFLSKEHAAFARRQEEWVVDDSGSRNGTFVYQAGSSPVRVAAGQPMPVADGAWIRIGRTFLRFRAALPCAAQDQVGPVVRLSAELAPPGLISVLPELEQQFDQVETLARQPFRGVLISGETGTGKELLARALHDLSPRARRPFVSVNCGRLGEHAHAELFGVEGRTFANAEAKQGFVRKARGGTLFLDEIGKLALDVQDSLLRVLDNGEIQPVGADRTETIPLEELNVVFAANEDLGRLARAGRFLPDLRARLGAIELKLPPLRDRMEDVGLIFAQLFRQLHAEHLLPDAEGVPLSIEATSAIVTGSWPWNIRGLREGLRAELVKRADKELGPESFEEALQRQAEGAEVGDGPARPSRRRLLSEEQERRRGEILAIYAEYVLSKGERGAKSHVAAALGYKGVAYLAKDELRLGITRGDYEQVVGEQRDAR
jgi:DNA-binding NtrC family response regulator